MQFGTSGYFQKDDLVLLVVVIAVAASASLIVFAACFCWFRRQQRRLHKQLLNAVANASRDPDTLYVTGKSAIEHGELVAQFKVNHGKQVVSLLEADGKRFIHVDGQLSASERAKMVRYLKSEGFMS